MRAAYKCPVPACPKTFAVRSNARRHLRIHGVPPRAGPGPSAGAELGSPGSSRSPSPADVFAGGCEGFQPAYAPPCEPLGPTQAPRHDVVRTPVSPAQFAAGPRTGYAACVTVEAC